MAAILERKQVTQSDKWNIEALFSSEKEWETFFSEKQASSEVATLLSFKGHLHEGEAVLKKALKLFYKLSSELEKLYTYAHLRFDEEITNTRTKSAFEKATAALYLFQEKTSWLQPEILSLPKKTLNVYLNNPSLNYYRFQLEKIIRLRPHTLSTEKETLLAQAGKSLETASKAFSSLNNADIKFLDALDVAGKPHPLSHGLYQLYLRSNDRALRASAFKNIHAQYRAHENTLCDLISGQVHNHIFEAKARSYSSCLESALFPKNVPVTVYETLIKTVRAHLPVLHRYISLRKKALKLDELHLYDMYLPLLPKVDIKMDYNDAEEVVIESVAPLGQEYQNILRKGLCDERWVDRFENQNKRSGAYSSGCYGSFPYILMNFKGILRDTFTLAHEAGHSMHTFLSNATQSYHNAHYPIFVAEVASTFNEELLTQLLLKKFESKEERLFLINEKVEDIRATLFRQTMFAEFELKIHQLVESGEPLTPGLLNTLYLSLNKEYFGPDIVIDEEIASEWARIPHFYYNFYVYQYATGISAALSLSSHVLGGDEKARAHYLNFLQSGGSRFPIDLLKVAGVDMTQPTVIEETIKKFSALVSELEANL